MDPEIRAEPKWIAHELKKLLRAAKEVGDPLLVYLLERATAQAEKPEEWGDSCQFRPASWHCPD
jgi:hypothetical protein